MVDRNVYKRRQECIKKVYALLAQASDDVIIYPNFPLSHSVVWYAIVYICLINYISEAVPRYDTDSQLLDSYQRCTGHDM